MTKLTLIALALATGCIDDVTDDDLSSSEQEVGGTLLTSLKTCNNGSWSTRTCDFELTDAAGHMCFIAGIKGSLNGDFPNLGGEVSFVSDAGKLWLRIIPPTGINRSLSASAICIAPATAVGSGTWQTGEAAKNLGNVPGQQCFLTKIQNFGKFTSSADQVSAFQTNGTGPWRLGGGPANPSGSTASVRVSAACIVPTGGSLWGWGWAWNGNNTFPLAQNHGGVACALSKIQGTFTSASDQISLGYDPQLVQWNVRLAGTSHGVGATCFD